MATIVQCTCSTTCITGISHSWLFLDPAKNTFDYKYSMLAPLESQGQGNQQGAEDDFVEKVQGEVDISGRVGSVASVHNEGHVQIGRCESADCFRK